MLHAINIRGLSGQIWSLAGLKKSMSLKIVLNLKWLYHLFKRLNMRLGISNSANFMLQKNCENWHCVNFKGQRSTKRFFDRSQSMAEHAFRQHKCDCRVFVSYNEVQYNNIFGKSKFCFQKFRQKPNETFVAWWWSLWKYVCKH